MSYTIVELQLAALSRLYWTCIVDNVRTNIRTSWVHTSWVRAVQNESQRTCECVVMVACSPIRNWCCCVPYMPNRNNRSRSSSGRYVCDFDRLPMSRTFACSTYACMSERMHDCTDSNNKDTFVHIIVSIASGIIQTKIDLIKPTYCN